MPARRSASQSTSATKDAGKQDQTPPPPFLNPSYFQRRCSSPGDNHMPKKHIQSGDQKLPGPQEKVPAVCGLNLPAAVVFQELPQDDPETCRLCVNRIEFLKTREVNGRSQPLKIHLEAKSPLRAGPELLTECGCILHHQHVLKTLTKETPNACKTCLTVQERRQERGSKYDKSSATRRH